MHQTADHPSDSSSPSETPSTPFPWEWFDLEGQSEVVRTPRALASLPPIEQEGGHRAWSVELDGRIMPFKVLRRESHSGNGHPLTARPAVLLVHGMGLTIGSFRAIASHLLATHDLVLPDYSGFSLFTACDTSAFSMKTFVRGLWRIADALQLDHFSFGGNSLGGGLCLMAGIEQPERIDRMVLSNPACFPQALPMMYRIARVPLLGELFMATTAPEKFMGGVEFIGYVDKSRFDPELRSRYERSLGGGGVANRFRLMNIMRQLPADERDLTPALHVRQLDRLKMPILISWGEHDPLLTNGAGARLASALPNATLELYPDLSHMPHEEAPERIGKRWAEFLNAQF